MATRDKGSCPYSFYRIRRPFKNFERGIHYICQNDDRQQAWILPFSNFHLRIQRYIEANATWKTVGLCYEPCLRVSEHDFLQKPDQPKEAKLNFDFVFSFIGCCSYYQKIRLAYLKPQLPTQNDNLKFQVVVGIWMQLQNYYLSIKISI